MEQPASATIPTVNGANRRSPTTGVLCVNRLRPRPRCIVKSAHWSLATVIFLWPLLPLTAGEPQLQKSDEQLSAADEKSVRDGVYEHGPRVTGQGGTERPFQRVFVIPRDVKLVFGKKPEATARLLLKIIEGGRPWDSIHAAACIRALISGPPAGAFGIPTDEETWDEPVGSTSTDTPRHVARKECTKLVIESERGRRDKSKD
jgi:hypothetical protein